MTARRGPEGGPLWLSHHPPEELHRTYRLGPVRVCARCAGLYPVALGAIALQLGLGAPLHSPLDGPLMALLGPGLVDWAVGRFRPRWGSNPWRTFTGVLLGLSLGRSLFIHLHRPYHGGLLAQAGVVLAVAVPVILLVYRRRGAE
jgi:uncharacterized membrane protein